jgi:ADP-ribose pyrophosphatase YjhB (NUDIX family)
MHPFLLFDAAKRDPTGTAGIRAAFRTAGRQRLHLYASALNRAVTEEDRLGLLPGGVMAYHAPSVRQDAFANWLGAAGATVASASWSRPFLAQAWDKGVLDASFDLGTPLSTDADASYLCMLCDQEVKGIMAALHQQLNRAAEKLITLHAKPAGAYRELKRVFDAVAEPRLHMLAHALTIRAYNDGKLQAYHQAGVTQVGMHPEWLPQFLSRDAVFNDLQLILKTAGDDRVCDECDDAAEESPYSIQDAMGIIPLHPHCRCTWVPFVETGRKRKKYADADIPFDPSLHPTGYHGRFIETGGHDWKKIGPQKGSNPGGLHVNEKGEQWYVKTPPSADHIHSDVLANELYRLAGVKVPEEKVTTLQGHPALASRILEGAKTLAQLTPAERTNVEAQLRTHLAVDAWLANWDVVGLEDDNVMMTPDGTAYRIDQGGTLKYRAQGALKPKFDFAVDEINTLRDPNKGPNSAAVFGSMTGPQIAASINKVLAIPDAAILALAKNHGMEKVGETLIKRKQWLASQRSKFIGKGQLTNSNETRTFASATSLSPETLNGILLKQWHPPKSFKKIDGMDTSLDEPTVSVPSGKAFSAGVLIREPDGRVWIVRPKGEYGGYKYTFPKGRVEGGLSAQATAIKEAWEESGLKVRITGYAGDYEGDTTLTRYYYATREGGDPHKFGEETEAVLLMPKSALSSFLNKERDKKIAAEHLKDAVTVDAGAYDPMLHPHAGGGPGGGQFITTVGTTTSGTGKAKKVLWVPSVNGDAHAYRVGKILELDVKRNNNYRWGVQQFINEARKLGGEHVKQIPALKLKIARSFIEHAKLLKRKGDAKGYIPGYLKKAKELGVSQQDIENDMRSVKAPLTPPSPPTPSQAAELKEPPPEWKPAIGTAEPEEPDETSGLTTLEPLTPPSEQKWQQEHPTGPAAWPSLPYLSPAIKEETGMFMSEMINANKLITEYNNNLDRDSKTYEKLHKDLKATITTSGYQAWNKAIVAKFATKAEPPDEATKKQAFIGTTASATANDLIVAFNKVYGGEYASEAVGALDALKAAVQALLTAPEFNKWVTENHLGATIPVQPKITDFAPKLPDPDLKYTSPASQFEKWRATVIAYNANWSGKPKSGQQMADLKEVIDVGWHNAASEDYIAWAEAAGIDPDKDPDDLEKAGFFDLSKVTVGLKAKAGEPVPAGGGQTMPKIGKMTEAGGKTHMSVINNTIEQFNTAWEGKPLNPDALVALKNAVWQLSEPKEFFVKWAKQNPAVGEPVYEPEGMGSGKTSAPIKKGPEPLTYEQKLMLKSNIVVTPSTYGVYSGTKGYGKMYEAIQQFNAKWYNKKLSESDKTNLNEKFAQYNALSELGTQIAKDEKEAAKQAEKEAFAKYIKTPEDERAMAALSEVVSSKSTRLDFISSGELWLKNHAGEIPGTVTPIDMAFIKAYTAHYFDSVNASLRDTGNLEPKYHDFAVSLNRALEKIGVRQPYIGTTYRKTDLPADVRAKYKVGKVITEFGFTSTSTDPNKWSGTDRYIIHGKTGVDVDPFSSNSGEKEVLYPAMQQFKVLSIKGNVIEMEEMDKI